MTAARTRETILFTNLINEPPSSTPLHYNMGKTENGKKVLHEKLGNENVVFRAELMNKIHYPNNGIAK